jgi:hypothetical protein
VHRRVLQVVRLAAAPAVATCLAALTACSAPEHAAGPTTPDAATGDDAADVDGGASDGAPCVFCPSDAAIDASLALLVKWRIDQTCTSTDGCHGSGQEGLGLWVGNEFAPLIDADSTERPDMKRVRPGDPLRSYAYLKVWCDGGIDRSCMPYGQTPDPALAVLFHDWIEAGAPTP